MFQPTQSLSRVEGGALRCLLGSYVLFATLWVLFARILLVDLVTWFSLDPGLPALEGPIFVGISCCFLILLLTWPAAQAQPRDDRDGPRSIPEPALDRPGFRAAARVAKALPWSQDGRTGELHFPEDTTLELVGIPLGQTLDLRDVLDGAGQEAFLQAREEARDAGRASFEVGLPAAADGSRRWTRWTVTWCEGRCLGTVQDISELRALAEQLHQSQKLEHLGSYLSGITHDFNNILSGVLGYNEMLLMDPALTPLQRRSLEVMHRSASRGRSLANHLLRYVRKDPPERRSSNLNDLVREVQALLEAPGPDRVAVHLDLDPELPDLAMDTTQMVQVLMNLLANARDALHGEGRISCATRVLRRSRAEAQEVGGPAGPCVLVEVRDTGRGIAREHQERIFEPFFTTKGAGKGSGLGLSLVQGIVQAHGGAIRCRSALGQGTVFQVLLPLQEKSAPPWAG